MEQFFRIADQLTNAQAELLAATDGFDFFAESFRKQTRLQEVAARSGGGQFSRILVVDDPVNLGNLAPRPGGLEVIRKTADWFRAPGADAEQLLRGAVVVFTNNNFAALGPDAYRDLTQQFPENLYIVWDFDNHHWLQNSGRAALLADLYVPAHYDNFFLISRFNPFSLAPTNCGVVQWSADFLQACAPAILAHERSNEPLGHHTAWNFPYRLKVLQTFASKLAHVGVCSPGFNAMTPAERLDEWCSHKAHIVIPVYNDMPIRIFDALITGGIPVLPRSLWGWARLSGIDEDEAVFYDALDIVEPAALVDKANTLFDASGRQGMMRRMEKALRLFHVDARVSSIVKQAESVLRSFG